MPVSFALRRERVVPCIVAVVQAYGGRVNDPVGRLEIVRQAVPVDLDAAVLTESWSNDTWLAGGSVLRVCWRGDRERLAREALLLESLPPRVPHATVLAAGRTGALTWMVLRRLPGERLDLVWRTLPGGQQRDAVVGLAGALKALHGWKPPPAVRLQLKQAPLTPLITPDDVVGAGIVPLPISHLLPLLAWLEEQPAVNSDLAGRVRRRIGELRPLVSEAQFEDGVVVHGDASFANMLWHQGRLVALLDLEWARLGPPDLEFATLGGDDAGIQAGGSSRAISASELPLFTWLRAGYPELFEREHLTERVWLYDLCFRIRQICAWRRLDPRSIQDLAALATHPRVRFP
jgi:aminoglycoside phosphotransferase (APT) family kinase protein